MKELTLDTVISKRNELLSSTIDGEVVMMNIETGKYVSMNEVGSEIWKIIDGTEISVKSICNELLRTFEVDKRTCETEVLNFCNQLFTEDLIKVKL